MRLCSYVVAIDTGFAPNPFWRYCTLAACTPNHMGIRLSDGDWIIGNSNGAVGVRLIFGMRISEVLDFNDYFHDGRFAKKKASNRGWRHRCGDNIYRRDRRGKWIQETAFFHKSVEMVAKDTRNPRVYISDHFFYFGEKALRVPAKFQDLLKRGRGCTCREGPEAERFVAWLQEKYRPGIHGDPRDAARGRECSTDAGACE